MISNDLPLPAAVVSLIQALVKRADVQSVSFPFQLESVWRILVSEQIERAKRSGQHLQHAFGLSGPDSGLQFDTADWGGYVHIPYEGMCEGDLIVKPAWRACDLREAMGDGSLKRAMHGKSCRHLLVYGLQREVDCARSMHVDGWTLYSDKGPYAPCNPFLDRQFDPVAPLPTSWRLSDD